MLGRQDGRCRVDSQGGGCDGLVQLPRGGAVKKVLYIPLKTRVGRRNVGKKRSW